MSYSWVHSGIHQGIPHNAVHAGNDSDGSPIYVGRAFHDGDQLPAKVIPSKNACYISHNGSEIFKPNYEVLCGSGMTWIGSSNGHVPAGAISTGNTNTGEPLYVGRAHHEGSLTPGKIHRSHGCMYMPYGGIEHSILHYEVLVGQQRSQWINVSAHSPPPPGAIIGGNDSDGTPIYVGRCFHEGDQMPCKAMPGKKVAYCCYNGQEIAKYSYEILCNGNTSWVHSSHGSVPPNAVSGGRTSAGEPLYIGRTWHQGSLTVGKIHPSHGSLYIPYGGAEIPFKQYEVLIEN
jgi:hypothetical protein